MKNHKDLYKGKPLQNERNQRNRVNIELRNEMRNDIIEKRRILLSENIQEESNVDISHLLTKISSNNLEEVLAGTDSLRQALNSDQTKLYQQVVDNDFIDPLIRALSYQNEPVLINTIIIFSNLADALPKYTPKLVKLQLVDIIFGMIESSNLMLQDSVLQALFNILDHCESIISIVKRLPIVEKISKILSSPIDNNIKTSAISLMHLLAKDSKVIRYMSQYLHNIIDLFKNLMNLNDIKITSQCIWILAAFCDNSDTNADIIVNDPILLNGILKLVVSNHVPKLINPVIRLFGNISAGNDAKTEAILNLGCLDTLSIFKDFEENKIKKEFLWFVSNIAAGTYDQAKLLYSARLHIFIYECFTTGTVTIQKEALWVISNLLYNAKSIDAQYWIYCGLIPVLGQMLDRVTDNEMIKLAIECFQFMFQNCSEESEYIRNQIESCGAFDSLNKLFDSLTVTEDIMEMAEDLLENYFKDNVMDEYPAYTNDMSFDF